MDNAIPSLSDFITERCLVNLLLSLCLKQKCTTPVIQEPQVFIKDATQKGKDIATKELNIPHTYHTKVCVVYKIKMKALNILTQKFCFLLCQRPKGKLCIRFLMTKVYLGRPVSNKKSISHSLLMLGNRSFSIFL